MFRLLLILFIVTPIAEFSLLFYLSDTFGLPQTVALVLVTGVVGAWLAKAQGYRTWRRIQDELARGQMPSSTLLDAMLIFLAGALLVTPGVLTDLLGFSLLIPPCREFYKRLARRYFGARFQIHTGHVPPGGSRPGSGGSTQIIDSYVIEDEGERTESTDTSQETPSGDVAGNGRP